MAGNLLISKYDYAVNSIGQRTQTLTSGLTFVSFAPSYDFTYNLHGNLIEADDSSLANFDRAFQYDSTGNREKTVNGLLPNLPPADNYTANGKNQYTAVNGLLPVFDQDGNATSFPLPEASGSLSTLTWDAENRLRTATVNGSTVSYEYDFLGRRISREVQGGATDYFVYSGWNRIARFRDNNLDRLYAWGLDMSGAAGEAGGISGLLAVQIGGADYYPTYDGNGNVSEYLNSAGNAINHYDYDAFGNTLFGIQVPSAPTFDHQFSTKVRDGATGLYDYGYRDYSPTSGSWMSRDPIGERGGLNLYGFVNNDGVNRVDPLGQKGLWGKFKEAVRGTLAVGPIDAYNAAFGDIGSAAQDFGNKYKNPKKNAMRHCYWQARLTMKHGEDDAKDIGDAHEAGEEETCDSKIDQKNNEVGRKIGKKAKSVKDIEKMCKEALANGELTLECDEDCEDDNGGDSSGSEDSRGSDSGSSSS